MGELIEYDEVPPQMAALQKFLLMHGPISRRTDNKVFVDGIPKRFASVKPLGCINMTQAGGPEDQSEAPRDRVRVYVFSYGTTPLEANRIDLAVLVPLKRLRGVVITLDEDEKIYIKNACPSGPYSGRDSALDWPYVRRSYIVQFGQTVG